jgi:hypothetical protein
MQVSKNLCHGSGAIDEFATLGRFPPNTGLLLELLQSSLVNVFFLLFEEFYTCEQDFDISSIFSTSKLELDKVF